VWGARLCFLFRFAFGHFWNTLSNNSLGRNFMEWIAPSATDADNAVLEKQRWDVAVILEA
jgi:hypothetical protein